MHAYTSRFVEQSGRKVNTSEGDLEAEQVVVTMAHWISELLARLGMKVSLSMQSGYHMLYSAENEAKLNHWVMDAEKGFLLEPMRAGIRLTTVAKLADLHSPPQYEQLTAAEK